MAAKSIHETVAREVKLLKVRAEHPRPTVLVVSVRRHDGMSWSASAADRAVAATDPDLPRIHVDAERSGDAVAAIQRLGVEPRAIAGLAARYHLTLRHRRLSAGRMGAAAALAVVAGAAAAVLAGSVLFLGVAAVFAAAAVFAYRAGERARSQSEVLAAVIDDVEAGRAAKPDAYKRLVTALAGRLVTSGSCVVVDRLEALDDLSRHVIRAALAGSPGAAGIGLWILFESAETGELAKDVVVAESARMKVGGSGVTVKLLDQLLLSRAERQRFAESIGQPKRAGYKAIGDIAGRREPGADVADEDSPMRFFSGLRGGDQLSDATLELWYLLAITATTRTNLRFKRRTIERTFAGHLSKKGRWAPLRVAMPASSLTLTEIRDQLDEIAKDYGPVMQPHADGMLAIDRQAAEELIRHRDELDLAELELCHLFWALYWFDTKQNDEGTVWLDKLIGHLLEAAVPSALLEADEGLLDKLMDACLHAIRTAIGASVLTEVPDLLTKGAELIGGDPNAPGAPVLRRLAWEAYALLGDERILGVLLELGDATPTPTPGASPRSAKEELEVIFAQSVSLGTDPTRSRDQLLASLRQLDPAIRSYAQMRAAWLVITWWRAAPSPGPYWGHLVDNLAPVLQGIVMDAADRLQHEGQGRVPVDTATVSIGCWVIALGALANLIPSKEAVEILVAVYVAAADLPARRPASSRTGDRYDLPLKGLSQDLMVSAGGSAVVLRRLQNVDHKMLRELIREAVRAASRPASQDGLAAEIEDRMDLTEYMWRRLGFDQLRSFMTLRRAHLTGLIGEGSTRTEDEVVANLADDRDRPDHAGLIAQALAADVTVSSRAVGRHLAYGAELALKARVAPALGADLCLLALGAAHADPETDTTGLVEYLFEPTVEPPHRAPVLERLGALSDEQVKLKALELLNVAKRIEDKALARRILEPLEQRRDDMPEGPDRETLTERLDAFTFELDLRDPARGVTSAQAVKDWRHRGDGMSYAWVLHLLIDRDPTDTTALTHAAAHLGALDDEPSMSGPIILAGDLLEALSTKQVREELEGVEVRKGINAAVEYLKKWRRGWSRGLAPKLNMGLLRYLMEYDQPNHGEYRRELSTWEARALHDDFIAKLLPLRAGGRWFLIVWHYFDTLAKWGLPLHPKRSPYDIAQQAGTECQPLLAAWRAGDAEPTPFVSGPEGQAFSTDFALVGYALFSERAFLGSEWKPQRGAINELSSEAIMPMLDMAARLPYMPHEIGSVLQRHMEALAVPDVVDV